MELSRATLELPERSRAELADSHEDSTRHTEPQIRAGHRIQRSSPADPSSLYRARDAEPTKLAGDDLLEARCRDGECVNRRDWHPRLPCAQRGTGCGSA